ncbi:hypothetical protein Sme01_32700 [Sphaerisporangium melleum]|uniref:ABC transporter permease n=1 Tax=Sphaerisporangium melleum TaxID=321316 RepID=A0A917RIV9_9ACTN|nr:hypothetical protein [Sphaerisporangium melleum]GGL09974.1 hypothetical protein GCM10007964_60190 [Sphaerisporangium melleum]GII70794.1 hypothetical protein Sme01_32700 [Sphaerisporangium melleum]
MRQLRDFGLTVIVLALLGVAAGFLWSVLAPRTPYVVTKTGPQLADPTTQTLIAADGWFAVITGAAGLACGIVAYLIARKGRPLALLAGLAAGGLLAGWLALSVGTSVGGSMIQAAAAPGGASAGDTVNVLSLTARGVLLAWPLVAVAVFGIIESVDGYRDSPPRHPYAGEPAPPRSGPGEPWPGDAYHAGPGRAEPGPHGPRSSLSDPDSPEGPGTGG